MEVVSGIKTKIKSFKPSFFLTATRGCYLWLQKDFWSQRGVWDNSLTWLDLCKHFPADFMVSVTDFG